MMLRGAPGAPTVSELAAWNIQMALVSPWASRVRSEPVRMYEPPAALYMPGARTCAPSWPALGSMPPGRDAGDMFLKGFGASGRAWWREGGGTGSPFRRERTGGGGGAVSIFPFTS